MFGVDNIFVSLFKQAEKMLIFFRDLLALWLLRFALQTFFFYTAYPQIGDFLWITLPVILPLTLKVGQRYTTVRHLFFLERQVVPACNEILRNR